MSWFDRWLARKVKAGWEQQKDYDEQSAIKSISSAAIAQSRLNGIGIRDHDSHGGLDSPADLNFRMYRAHNGYVMEVRYHDKRTDRQTMSMHIIPENEDLGDHISKIITYESLKAQ